MFQLEHDMENYIKYKIMGSVKRIQLKPHCIPSRFDFNRNHTTSNKSYLAEAKRLRISISKDSVQDHIGEDNDKAQSSYIKGNFTFMSCKHILSCNLHYMLYFYIFILCSLLKLEVNKIYYSSLVPITTKSPRSNVCCQTLHSLLTYVVFFIIQAFWLSLFTYRFTDITGYSFYGK